MSEVRYGMSLRRRAGSAGLWIGMLCGGLCGCQPAHQQTDYDVVTGTVESARAQTGELSVRATEPWSAATQDAPVLCLVTNDTEIYVDDRFSSFDAIAIGDMVELIGRPDASPRGERFVVSLVHIERNEPAPPPPDLSAPTTQPAGSIEES